VRLLSLLLRGGGGDASDSSICTVCMKRWETPRFGTASGLSENSTSTVCDERIIKFGTFIAPSFESCVLNVTWCAFFLKWRTDL
jgi:hypothetical protein